MNKFNRELGSKNLIAAYGYEGGEVVQNDFDSRYPWCDIERVIDENGNHWIRIPKFYTHYVVDENNIIKERYISQYRVEDTWHLNPIFINADGNEMPYVDIAAYQLSLDESNSAKSIPGVAPLYGGAKSEQELINSIDNYNTSESNYQYALYNVWANILEQDLFLVEFAQLEAGTKDDKALILHGRGGTKTILNTGRTDDIASLTGTITEAGNDNYTACMKYRGIENMFGNGSQYVAGLALDYGDIIVTDNQGTKISSLQAPAVDGQVHQLAFDPTTKLIFPANIQTTGAYGDIYQNATGKKIMIKGWSLDNSNGPFVHNFVDSAKSNSRITFRMIRYPKQ